MVKKYDWYYQNINNVVITTSVTRIIIKVLLLIIVSIQSLNFERNGNTQYANMIYISKGFSLMA